MGALFGGAPKAAPPPTPAPVQTMPDTESPEALAAKKRAMAARTQATGRASTLLSGSDYGADSTLGKM